MADVFESIVGGARVDPTAPSGARPPRANQGEQVAVDVVRVSRTPLRAKALPSLRELYGLEELPLAPTKVLIEISGVPSAVPSALRRALASEMPCHALCAPFECFSTGETTERHMLPEFVGPRIELIPLRRVIEPRVMEELRLCLRVDNPSASVRTIYSGDLTITAGEMPVPLFNPTIPLLVLQPGRAFVYNNISIDRRSGNAKYHAAIRAASVPIDLDEFDEKETHHRPQPGDKRGLADLSGYKDKQGRPLSSMVANPRAHRLTFTLQATGDARSETHAIFSGACNCITERLRHLIGIVRRGGGGRDALGGAQGASYSILELTGGLSEALLQIPGETATIGELLRRTLYETTPGLSYVKYEVGDSEVGLRLSLCGGGDLTAQLLGAAEKCIDTFDVIRRGVSGALT